MDAFKSWLLDPVGLTGRGASPFGEASWVLGHFYACLAATVGIVLLAVFLLGLVAVVRTGRQRVSGSGAQPLFHAPAPLLALDADGRVTDVSACWLRMFGYARSSIVGGTIAALYRPGAAHDAAADWQLVAGGGELTEQERCFVHRDGTCRDVLLSARRARDDAGAAILVAVTDITGRRATERALRSTRRLLAAVVETLPAALSVNDTLEGRYLLVNQAGEALLGIRRSDIAGDGGFEFLPDVPAAGGVALHEAYDVASAEEIVRSDTRGTRLLQTRRVSLPGDDGRPRYVMSFTQDVTQHREAAARLAHLTAHDTLTGLANRTLFHERLVAATEAGATGLMLLNLDDFKRVNDVFGHGLGDTVLREVAGRLTKGLEDLSPGGAWTVARLGGDEFALLLPGLGEAAEAAAVARALLVAVQAPLALEGGICRVGGSIGIALGPAHGEEPDTLVANADLALYAAKDGGGDSSRLFEPALRMAYDERRILEAEVAGAAGRGELELHYQPQIDLRNGRLVGAEALLRWNHPVRGLLPPAAFLPAIEAGSLGSVAAVGDWILAKACGQAAAWRAAGLPPLRIGVNVFRAQLAIGGLDTVVTAALGRSGLPPSALELELTENIMLGQDKRMLEPLRRLRDLGVGIAFDDFGTGFASLSTLKSFPLTRLKIDRSFVKDLGEDGHDEAIVAAVLTLGRKLGLQVIAEGVESVVQETMLISFGCTEVQGYRYGKPMPPEVFAGRMQAPATA